jgi:hypothetical protein
LIELSRAGLGDDVLLALIEVDRPVFAIDTATLRTLKEAGVSEKVIVAVVRSGRVPADSTPASEIVDQPPSAQPQVIVIEHREQAQVHEVKVPVAVPVYIPVYPRKLIESRTPKPQEPVYWGWGGKLRPDAWQPTPVPPPVKGDPVVRIDPSIR